MNGTLAVDEFLFSSDSEEEPIIETHTKPISPSSEFVADPDAIQLKMLHNGKYVEVPMGGDVSVWPLNWMGESEQDPDYDDSWDPCWYCDLTHGAFEEDGFMVYFLKTEDKKSARHYSEKYKGILRAKNQMVSNNFSSAQ